MMVFFLLFCKITQLKIDANPFAKAYRSDGLHGKAKRWVHPWIYQVLLFAILGWVFDKIGLGGKKKEGKARS